MNTTRGALGVLTAAIVALGATAVGGTTSASADPESWEPVGSAEITPGVQMYTSGAQCTGNFIFRDGAGRTYVGYASHCAGKGEATDTNGCKTRSVPLGTPVRFARGATVATGGETVGHGTLAYSSWRTMRSLGESRGPVCAANDFALVRVDHGDVGKVNPSVPFWGGPTGLSGRAPAGSQVYSYGQSSLRPTEALSPKTGESLGPTYQGWGFDVYTATPGIPGDSGSGFLNAQGKAVGTLSTVAIAPLPASNGLGNLARELNYAQNHSGIAGLHLVRGTEPFSPVAP